MKNNIDKITKDNKFTDVKLDGKETFIASSIILLVMGCLIL